MNVRHAVAGHEVLDEAEAAAASGAYRDAALPARVKAAFALTDAFLLHPDDVDEETRRAALAELTSAEIVELAFAVGRFQSGSKLRILFGLVPEIASGTVV